MLDKLKLYLDLYEIEDDGSLESAAIYIEHNLDKQILNHSKYGYILVYYKQLLELKISDEEFLQIGDISNTKVIYKAISNEILFDLESRDDKDISNSIVLVSIMGQKYYKDTRGSKYKVLIDRLKTLGTEVFIL